MRSKLFFALAVSLSSFAIGGALLADEPKPETAVHTDTDTAMEWLLGLHKLSLGCSTTDLLEAAKSLTDATGVNVVVDPEVASARVTVDLNGKTLRDSLDLIATAYDGRYEAWRGVIFLTRTGSKSTPPPRAKLTDAAKKAWHGRKVNVNFPGISVSEVAKFLSDISEVSFDVGAGVDGKVDVHLKDASLGSVVDAVCRVAGLKIECDGDVNVFKRR